MHRFPQIRPSDLVPWPLVNCIVDLASCNYLYISSASKFPHHYCIYNAIIYDIHYINIY